MNQSSIIKPKQQAFDIINPSAGAKGDGQLRMSRHAMFVVDQRGNKPDMNVAGVKKIANQGEESIQAIWPKSETPKDSYNVRNRSLDCADID